MSEFIFTAKTFRPRHDAVIEILQQAECMEELNNDRIFGEKHAEWQRREDKRVAERVAAKVKKDAEEAARVKVQDDEKIRINKMRNEFKDQAHAKFTRQMNVYPKSDFWRMFTALPDYSKIERDVFTDRGWAWSTSEDNWMPIEDRDDYKDSYPLTIRSYRPCWEDRMFKDYEPTRHGMFNRFSNYLYSLKPITDALQIGADEVRLSDDLMHTFTSAENNAQDYINKASPPQ